MRRRRREGEREKETYRVKYKPHEVMFPRRFGVSPFQSPKIPSLFAIPLIAWNEFA
jgi:hypothetical protein